ncbi:hypothetical protein PT974_00405 [Cladobotryum mycophilum]|uniref:Integrase zinc-binding domain-containing protein n=1 Tax=Cladobotryum mycophilum TaxID=491253 RepID=A0ABR0T0T3_9HYPO
MGSILSVRLQSSVLPRCQAYAGHRQGSEMDNHDHCRRAGSPWLNILHFNPERSPWNQGLVPATPPRQPQQPPRIQNRKNARPSTQKEFSRRNYARKSYKWDESTQTLIAAPNKSKEKDREVVTDDMIVDIVEQVHIHNHHSGWDATWKDISASYYGIMRVDVIFLLKQCVVCANDPRKRPKGFAYMESIPYPVDDDDGGPGFIDDFVYDQSTPGPSWGDTDAHQ